MANQRLPVACGTYCLLQPQFTGESCLEARDWRAVCLMQYGTGEKPDWLPDRGHGGRRATAEPFTGFNDVRATPWWPPGRRNRQGEQSDASNRGRARQRDDCVISPDSQWKLALRRHPSNAQLQSRALGRCWDDHGRRWEQAVAFGCDEPCVAAAATGGNDDDDRSTGDRADPRGR